MAAELYLRTPDSPDIGCYERIVGGRRRRTNSTSSKLYSEGTLSEERRCVSALNVNIYSDNKSNERGRSIGSPSTSHRFTSERNRPRSSENSPWRTTPRAHRIRDKSRSKRRVGSSPDVTFYLPDDDNNSVTVTQTKPIRIPLNDLKPKTKPQKAERQRCLQFVIEDIDSGMSFSAKSSNDSLDCNKLSVPKPSGRRRSMPAIFSIKRESSSPLSLFKRSSPNLVEDQRIENERAHDIQPKKRSPAKKRSTSSWTLPLFPWIKKNGSKSSDSSEQ